MANKTSSYIFLVDECSQIYLDNVPMTGTMCVYSKHNPAYINISKPMLALSNSKNSRKITWSVDINRTNLREHKHNEFDILFMLQESNYFCYSVVTINLIQKHKETNSMQNYIYWDLLHVATLPNTELDKTYREYIKLPSIQSPTISRKRVAQSNDDDYQPISQNTEQHDDGLPSIQSPTISRNKRIARSNDKKSISRKTYQTRRKRAKSNTITLDITSDPCLDNQHLTNPTTLDITSEPSLDNQLLADPIIWRDCADALSNLLITDNNNISNPPTVSAPNIPETPDSNTSETPDSNISEMPDSNISEMPDSNISEMPDSNISEMPDSNISEMPDSNITEMPDSNISEMPDSNISEMPDSNITETPDSNISEMPDSNISEMPDSNISEISEPNGSSISNTTEQRVDKTAIISTLDVTEPKIETTVSSISNAPENKLEDNSDASLIRILDNFADIGDIKMTSPNDHKLCVPLCVKLYACNEKQYVPYWSLIYNNQSVSFHVINKNSYRIHCIYTLYDMNQQQIMSQTSKIDSLQIHKSPDFDLSNMTGNIILQLFSVRLPLITNRPPDYLIQHMHFTVGSKITPELTYGMMKALCGSDV
jgi:hypothetical protein